MDTIAPPERRDLSGDGGVISLMPASKAGPRPTDLSTVVISYSVRHLLTSESDEQLTGGGESSDRTFQFTVDDGTAQCAGLDYAVKDMCTGDRRTFLMTQAYAPPSESGRSEHDGISEVEVTLQEVELPAAESEEMSSEAKIAYAELMRGEGNRWFAAGEHARADRRYSAALNAIAFDQGYTASEKAAVRHVGLLCFLNRAQCCLKLKQWDRARKDADMALKIEGASVKAHYRRGVACAELGMWAEARLALEKVLEAEPSNSSARRELQRVRKGAKLETQREAQAFSKLFEKPLCPDREPDHEATEGRCEGADDEGVVEGDTVMARNRWLGWLPPVWAGTPVLGVFAVCVGLDWRSLEPKGSLGTIWVFVGALWLLGPAALGATSVVTRRSIDDEGWHMSTLSAACLAFSLLSMNLLHVGAGLLPGDPGGRFEFVALVARAVVSAGPLLYFVQHLGGWNALGEVRRALGDGQSGKQSGKSD